MKTVKLTISNKIDVLDDMRVFSSIVRVAYNRYQDGMDEKEVRAYCNNLFAMNRWFIQCAIKEAAALYKLNGDKRILFGGKNNLHQYLTGISLDIGLPFDSFVCGCPFERFEIVFARAAV